MIRLLAVQSGSLTQGEKSRENIKSKKTNTVKLCAPIEHKRNTPHKQTITELKVSNTYIITALGKVGQDCSHKNDPKADSLKPRFLKID